MAKMGAVILLFLFPGVSLAAPLASTTLEVVGDISECLLEFSVEKSDTYAVRIDYDYSDEGPSSRERVWKAAGGRLKDKKGAWNKPGAPFDIDASIVEIKSGRELYRGYVSRPLLSSWSSSSLHAELFRLNLKSGNYQLHANRIGESKALVGLSVKISIVHAYNGK
ncbi:transporter [Pseudomonas syringae]|uniref:transporter n=1 Tax=Pseudomonas syringae TaxID=317 RepID=UPI000A7E8166|nr:transporter [Pseudomonas syringae]